VGNMWLSASSLREVIRASARTRVAGARGLADVPKTTTTRGLLYKTMRKRSDSGRWLDIRGYHDHECRSWSVHLSLSLWL
jgi:hypothetical protein